MSAERSARRSERGARGRAHAAHGARRRTCRARRAAAALSLVALAAACGPGGDSAARGGGGSTADLALAATPERLPPHAPSRFGFGSEVSEARVALWDVDVKPDGEGLPPGRGSVAQGAPVYAVHCVSCHGPGGTEGPYDRLVGREPWEDAPTTRTVGNYWPYATTLFDYIRRAMPQLTPGILTADETYAVVAYVLHLNDIVPEDAVLSAETLPEVVMPARDRFVVDDRRGGAGPIR